MHREAAPPRCGVTLGGVQRLVEGHSSLERGRHPTEASQVVTNPRIAAGSPVVSDWLRHFRCTEDKKIMNTYKNLLLTLDIGSHSNAPGELRPTAENARTNLKSVRCGPSALGKNRARG